MRGCETRAPPRRRAWPAPMHGTEGAVEGLRRAVAVADRHVEQRQLVAQHVRRGQREPPTADVLRDRHSGQRREHPPEVVLRGRGGPRHGGHLHVLTAREAGLDQVERLVQPFQDWDLLLRTQSILASPG